MRSYLSSKYYTISCPISEFHLSQSFHLTEWNCDNLQISLYTAIQEVGVTFISVGHRSSLRRFHKNILQFEEAKESSGTTWTLSKLPEADSPSRRIG